jgi:hypothetical protein
MLRNMEEKRDYDQVTRLTAQKENVRTWSSLRWRRTEKKKKQMADKAVGLNYESGLSMMTQPGNWWSTTGGN